MARKDGGMLEFYFICLYLLITHYILKFCITACVWVCVYFQIGKSEAIISLRNDVTFPTSFSYYSYKLRALDIFVLHIALINKALDFTEVVLYARKKFAYLLIYFLVPFFILLSWIVYFLHMGRCEEVEMCSFNTASLHKILLWIEI